MSNNSSTEQNNNNEIDLLQLLSTAGTYISKFVQTVFIFFLRKLIWFAVIFFATLLISFVLYERHTPAGTSFLIARMNNVSSALGNEYAVNRINEIAAISGDKAILTQALNLPDTAIAKKIKKISAHWGIDTNLDKVVDQIDENDVYIKRNAKLDSSKFKLMTDRFYVRAEVYDDNVIPYIKQGIIRLFEENSFLQQQNQIRLEQTQYRVKELKRQVNLLDSLQVKEYFDSERNSNRGKIVLPGPSQVVARKSNNNERQLFHDDIVDLNNYLLVLEEQLLLDSEPITIIQDFSTWTKPGRSYWTISKNLIIYTFILALLAAIVWDHRKWLLKKMRS